MHVKYVMYSTHVYKTISNEHALLDTAFPFSRSALERQNFKDMAVEVAWQDSFASESGEDDGGEVCVKSPWHVAQGPEISCDAAAVRGRPQSHRGAEGKGGAGEQDWGAKDVESEMSKGTKTRQPAVNHKLQEHTHKASVFYSPLFRGMEPSVFVDPYAFESIKHQITSLLHRTWKTTSKEDLGYFLSNEPRLARDSVLWLQIHE